jgi:hypothetical protein
MQPACTVAEQLTGIATFSCSEPSSSGGFPHGEVAADSAGEVRADFGVAAFNRN